MKVEKIEMEKNEGEALDEVDKAKRFLKNKKYKEAKDSMRRALQLFPKLKNALEMLIVCETLYYGGIDFPNFGIDWYSILHLYSSADDALVNALNINLEEHICRLETTDFPGQADALCLLKQAKSILCDKAKRIEYDYKRSESGLVDLRNSTKTKFRRQNYLQWQPPIFSPAFVDSNKKPRLDLSASVADKKPTMSLELMKLKNQVFDEMPQNPHYGPLSHHGSKVREGMIIGLDIAFAKLCEEIRQLDDPQTFSSKFNELRSQLLHLGEMGYDVKKLMDHLETLEEIAERGRRTLVELDDSEDKVKVHERRIADNRSYILTLEAEIQESKVLVDEHTEKIDFLKKDSMKVVQEFASAAKSIWK